MMCIDDRCSVIKFCIDFVAFGSSAPALLHFMLYLLLFVWLYGYIVLPDAPLMCVSKLI